MPKANFEIRVTDLNEDYFALMVTEAPNLSTVLAGKSFPILKKKLVELASPDLSCAINSKDDVLRAPGSPVGQSIEAFGAALFDAVVWDHGDADLRESWKDFDRRSGQSRSLRLILASQLPDLPWEALRDRRSLNPSVARQFSLVRHAQISPSLDPVDIGDAPLRMLVVFSDPEGDLSVGAIERERAAIQTALGPSVAGGKVCIDFVEAGVGPTLDGIKAKVAQHAYHVLHYFGHGHSTGRGQLDFEGARRGEALPVSWEDLYDVLQPTLPSLRLVILNACELAQPGEGLVSYTPFTDLSKCFLYAGVAMVVAMQYPIRVGTATTFTESFYEHLGAHSFESAAEVEEAVVKARKAIFRRQNVVEWITPVLFTRMQGQEDEIFRFAIAQGKTRRPRYWSLIVYAGIALAALALGGMLLWMTDARRSCSTPIISDPQAGDSVEMTISVSGPCPKGSLPSDTYFYLLVKPPTFNYYLQPTPVLSRTGWRVDEVGIGDKPNEQGDFSICAILTSQALSLEWSGAHADLPPGESQCINVVRR